jgi:general L-amino acid transport system substrate-binding protein
MPRDNGTASLDLTGARAAACAKGLIMKRLATAIALASLSLLATRASSAATLDMVKERGQLICGANGTLAGFGMPDPQGNWTGFDVDFCRAIAAAIFNDPTKVKFVPLTAKDRFTALQSGEVDVLSRNTTWTLSRDTSLGLDFVAVNFYDGQGFMVHKALKVSSALELDDATICVQQGTTTELNLADYFRSHHMSLKSVTFATGDEALKAYESGRCDSYTTDASGLYGERLQLSDPGQSIVLPEIISKEPLSAVVRQDDNQWSDIVRWAHFAMVDAEELGVTKGNVDEKKKSDDPEAKRLLGTEGQYGEALGLTNDWAYRILKHVGNYGESFERNLGQGSPLKIARGLNALWIANTLSPPTPPGFRVGGLADADKFFNSAARADPASAPARRSFGRSGHVGRCYLRIDWRRSVQCCAKSFACPHRLRLRLLEQHGRFRHQPNSHRLFGECVYLRPGVLGRSSQHAGCRGTRDHIRDRHRLSDRSWPAFPQLAGGPALRRLRGSDPQYTAPAAIVVLVQRRAQDATGFARQLETSGRRHSQ